MKSREREEKGGNVRGRRSRGDGWTHGGAGGGRGRGAGKTVRLSEREVKFWVPCVCLKRKARMKGWKET